METLRREPRARGGGARVPKTAGRAPAARPLHAGLVPVQGLTVTQSPSPPGPGRGRARVRVRIRLLLSCFLPPTAFIQHLVGSGCFCPFSSGGGSCPGSGWLPSLPGGQSLGLPVPGQGKARRQQSVPDSPLVLSPLLAPGEPVAASRARARRPGGSSPSPWPRARSMSMLHSATLHHPLGPPHPPAFTITI